MGFDDYSFQPGAPFDFLDGVECIQLPDESAHFPIHDFSPVKFAQYVDWVNYESGNFRDVGDRMVASYESRDGVFTPAEMAFSWKFFSDDYGHSVECVEECSALLERGVEGVDGKYLVGILLNRAYDDIFRGMMFGEVLGELGDWGYAESLASVALAKECLSVSREYPKLSFGICHDVVSMRQEMKEAVGEEEYERAAELRDGLAELVTIEKT